MYLRRIAFCLVDRNPEIRRIACEIRHKKYGKTISNIESLLSRCLATDFYLIDKKLKRAILCEGLRNVILCDNSRCFSKDKPCRRWPEEFVVTQPQLTLPHILKQRMQQPSSLGEKYIINTCMVCKYPIYNYEEREECPICHSLAHSTHLLEWVKIKGYCPNCNSLLKSIDFIDDLNSEIV